MTLSAYDSSTGDAEVDIDAAGLTFTDINNLTIALGNLSLTSTGLVSGADLQSITLTGGGTPTGGTVSTFDMGTNVITGVTTTTTVSDVTFNAADYSGVVKLTLNATANSLETVTTGSGADIYNSRWCSRLRKCF